MAIEEELLAIRLELKGQREAITGLTDLNKAQQGVASSTRKAGEESAKAEKKTLSLGSAYGKLKQHAGLALGFLGVAGVFQIEKAIHSTEELSKTTTGLVRNFDLQTNVASRWGAVAASREIDSKALGMTFGTLSTKLTNAAREGGKALLPFHQLGISQEGAAKGAHNFQWGIMRVAKALGEEEGGAQRAAAAKSLLGKSYATLLPLFSEGAEGLKEQLHWADEYGVTLSGSTNEGIQEMVTSQRELKVAQLGLQISMTKALMPAIEAGEEQIKQFIKTLNDPNMSGEEKIAAIERQFEGLETDLIRIFEKALPGISEHAGELGLKAALALFKGFRNSDIVGKLVIAGWIFSVFGGEALVKTGAKRVGTMIGAEMGLGLAGGLVGVYIGYEIWESLSKQTQAELVLTAEKAGADFANFFIRAWNAANPLPFGIGDKGEFHTRAHDLTPAEAFAPPVGHGPHKGILGGAGHLSNAQKRHNYEDLWGQPPPPGPPPWPAPRKNQRHNMSLEVPKLPSIAGAWSGSGGGRTLVVHTHLHVDGREITEVVTQHAEDEAAFR